MSRPITPLAAASRLSSLATRCWKLDKPQDMWFTKLHELVGDMKLLTDDLIMSVYGYGERVAAFDDAQVCLRAAVRVLKTGTDSLDQDADQVMGVLVRTSYGLICNAMAMLR